MAPENLRDDAYHNVGFGSRASFDAIDSEWLRTQGERAETNGIQKGGRVFNQNSISDTDDLG